MFPIVRGRSLLWTPPHKKGGRGRGDHHPQRSQHGVWVPNPTKHVTNRGGGMPQTAGVSLRPVWNHFGVKRGSLAPGSPLPGTPPQQPEALLELSVTPPESWRHSQSHRSRQGRSPMAPHQRLLHYLLEPFRREPSKGVGYKSSNNAPTPLRGTPMFDHHAGAAL